MLMDATQFQEMLSPYIIRRDKREDPEVQRFHEHSKLPINEYRRETEILVETTDLPMVWRRAVCAAESLSVVTRQSTDSFAKRLRLTLGNGHGIAVLLDQINRDEEADQEQEAHDGLEPQNAHKHVGVETADIKRQQRAEWWLNSIRHAFGDGDDSLFDHPAIQKAVEAIESETRRSEKVLVFGRFTRPMRALVDLLNAREMLRRVQQNQVWPQAKVHGDRDGNAEDSEWPAVRAAHRQLMSPLRLETLDETLRVAYESERQHRGQFRDHLISRIDEGMKTIPDPGAIIIALFEAFKRSVNSNTQGEQHTLALVARAMMELLEALTPVSPLPIMRAHSANSSWL